MYLESRRGVKERVWGWGVEMQGGGWKRWEDHVGGPCGSLSEISSKVGVKEARICC